MKIYLAFYITLTSFIVKAQFPIEEYRTEVKALSSKSQVQKYWKQIRELDQAVMVAEDLGNHDSIIQVNLIKATLMIEVHGLEFLDLNVMAPVTVYIHNNDIGSVLNYWRYAALGDSVLSAKRKEKGLRGGTSPSYVAEGACLLLYDYSVMMNEDSLTQVVYKSLNVKAPIPSAEKLVDCYVKNQSLQKLSFVKTIGSWNRMDGKEKNGIFRIWTDKDGNCYWKADDMPTIIKPLSHSLLNGEVVYKFNDDFLGWYYKENKSGDLELVNEQGKVFMTYPAIKQ